jgi:hypothetical protein
LLRARGSLQPMWAEREADVFHLMRAYLDASDVDQAASYYAPDAIYDLSELDDEWIWPAT